MMSVIMPNRNRKQLINKYHRETRLNPERIRQAFEKRKMLGNVKINYNTLYLKTVCFV